MTVIVGLTDVGLTVGAAVGVKECLKKEETEETHDS